MNRFTHEDRQQVRSRIISIARSDERTTGCADIGSVAENIHDRYSDIDITFGIKDGISVKQVLDDWTQILDCDFSVAHFFDVLRGEWIYRVILFSNALEMDLSVSPASQFGALGPNFKLNFGMAIERTEFPGPNITDMIGWGWHHILHTNSAIARGRLWHAAFWLNGLRDHVIALRCIRFGLPHAQSRGADRLPSEELMTLGDTLVRKIDPTELRNTLYATTREFIREIRHYNADIAERIDHAIKIAFESE